MNGILDYKNVTINVSLIKDAQSRELNNTYRQKDYATDVLSFNIDEEIDPDTYYLGDIAVNVDQATKQAEDFSNSIEEEISELVAHGVLHLLGIHHEGDEH